MKTETAEHLFLIASILLIILVGTVIFFCGYSFGLADSLHKTETPFCKGTIYSDHYECKESTDAYQIKVNDKSLCATVLNESGLYCERVGLK